MLGAIKGPKQQVVLVAPSLARLFSITKHGRKSTRKPRATIKMENMISISFVPVPFGQMVNSGQLDSNGQQGVCLQGLQAVQASQTLTHPQNSMGSANSSPTQSCQKPILPAQPELLRCKRRLHFNNRLPYNLPGKHTGSVERRNARERNRVQLINHTFVDLRNHLPPTYTTKNGKSKKMSKVDTLKSAIDYIRELQDILENSDAVNAVFDGNSSTSYYQAVSPSYSTSSSHESSCSGSESGGEQPPSMDDLPEDLLDFTSWF